MNKILVDDKGLLCLAAFGLPPLKHSDDPHRALMAAQVSRARARARALSFSLGRAT